MGGLTRAFGVIIALQFHALGIIFLAWWGGEWLNEHHPASVNWFLATFALAVLAIGQTFYLVIRHLWRQQKGSSEPSQVSQAGQNGRSN